MKNILTFLTLVFSTTTFAAAKPVEFATRCVGDQNAKKHAIFLHGMLPVSTLSSGAGASEAQLAELAKKHGYRIAIPRSHIVCPRAKSHHCWGFSDVASIESTYQGILKSASQCFDTNKPFVAIGFSDGGYHLGRVFMRGLSPQPKLTIAIGSAGNIGLAHSSDLSKSSRMTLLVGKSDGVLSRAKSFATDLGKKRGQVDFKTYDGGHVVPFDLLGTVLAQS